MVARVPLFVGTIIRWGLPRWQWVKNPPAIQETEETQVWSLGWEDLVEEEVVCHSSISAWGIPWTERQRVGHDWVTKQNRIIRWINEIGENIGAQLSERISELQWHAIQVDGSMDVDSKAMVLGFVNSIFRRMCRRKCYVHFCSQLKDWCWSWNSSTLATSWEELTHWKRPWFWERLRAGEGDDRGWVGWMASPTQWAWVWVNSRSWSWTGRPGVLQFMGSQRVGHSWATELNWTQLNTTAGELFKSLNDYKSGKQNWSFCVGIHMDTVAVMTGWLSGIFFESKRSLLNVSLCIVSSIKKCWRTKKYHLNLYLAGCD